MNMLSRLLFPEKCAGCDQALVSDEKTLCLHCSINLPVIINPNGPQMVHRALAGRVPHIESFAFLQYRNGSIVQRMLHQLKYYGREEVGQELGYLFGKQLTHMIPTSCCLVPVPLHYKKLRTRGFNQCDAICSGLSAAMEVEVLPHLLTRVKNKGSLTKLNRAQRAEATASLYRAPCSPETDSPEVVCVVDDVVTTGATMVACCEALFNAGWKKIIALALCYADS